jgi:hypothetical protein
MAGAQMALPVDCQPNGTTPAGATKSNGPAATKEVTVAAGPASVAVSDREPRPPAVSSAPAPPVGVSRGVQRITTVSVLAVALVAAVASYDHQRVLAELAGEGWRAWLLPISVDGLVVAASMSMLVNRRNGQAAGLLAWVALLLGLGASLAANVAAAEPTIVGRVVAGWPPLALLLAYELLMQQVRRGGGSGVQTVHPHRPSNQTPDGRNDGGRHESPPDRRH